ncbi:hypothetical protein ACFL20_09080 [Spirochaetota bacterium]
MKMKLKSLLVITIVISAVFMLADLSHAYRPLATEDAGVGASGELVIEGAYELAREGSDNTHAIAHALVIGLGKAELIFEAPYVLNGPGEGVGGVVIAAKLLLWGKDEGTGMLTIKSEYDAPGNAFGLSLVGSKTLFGPFQAHLQMGWSNNLVNGAGNVDGLFYGFALDFEAAKWLNIVAEITGEYYKEGGVKYKPTSFVGGLILKPMEMLAIDIGCGAGITDEADDVAFVVGVTLAL